LEFTVTERIDDDARGRALTDLNSTLLVEASAGTGKTSLLAGRVAMLLAAGTPAANIVAITFTEHAAAELRTRVDKFAISLAARVVPSDLMPAFKKAPLSDEQAAALKAARPHLGDLTASTIHAFCLMILQSYAVEARIDPGAIVLDADETEAAFKSVFDAWLGRRLGTDARLDDPVVVMAEYEPAEAVKVLDDLAKFRRKYPEARPGQPGPYDEFAREFAEAVKEYRRWLDGVDYPEESGADVAAFEDLATFYGPAVTADLSFAQLWALGHPQNDTLFGRRKRAPKAFAERIKAWKKAAGPDLGPQLSARARDHYDRCARTFADLLGSIGDNLLAIFFSELDELIAAFEEHKRNAAVLDFDDILIRTRDLLRANDKVREDVARRYRHILVDEFQDTDPIQAEILFLIAGDAGALPAWHLRKLRPGALFMVGDPKQAIYRFRRADLRTYIRGRDAVRSQYPRNVLQISANFRSGKGILSHVDKCFSDRLKQQQGGYAALDHTIEGDPDRLQSIAKLTYQVAPETYSTEIRSIEAKAVADLCARLVGKVTIRRSNGELALAAPGDIVLLSPTRTELWRYEGALEELGLPVASQAGKNLYRRQEAQDFVALVRALADSRDTLALGAVLRGPLVGLTERELLDVTQALREHDSEAVFDLKANLAHVQHPVAREAMAMLQDLWRKRRSTTPHALLTEAIERLTVIPSVASRGVDQRARSLANLGLLLERARSYDVRGLKQLAIDLGSEWQEGLATEEAPIDHQGDSIEIVTIHKAKGLEWPIVIPVNLMTLPRGENDFFFRSDDNTVHWTLGDIVSSTISQAIERDQLEAAEERARLLYVACTRALDLLVLPAPTWAPEGSWFRFLDLGQTTLDEVELPQAISAKAPSPVPSPPNEQSRSVFSEERDRILANSPRIDWYRPSEADVDRELLDQIMTEAALADSDLRARLPTIGAGPTRGTILHKLMEELILGAVAPARVPLIERARELTIRSVDAATYFDPLELADATLRTYWHEELAPYRDRLVSELPLFGVRSENILVAARADAVALDGDVAIAAFDWKSNVNPTAKDRAEHQSQLLEYLALIGAPTGAVVYMTSAEFNWITAR
jgi:ATP-dependent exoDNAse (exonuclease V) beta subunit